MWYLLPHVLAGIGIFVVFSCLGYYAYLTIKFNNEILMRSKFFNTKF